MVTEPRGRGEPSLSQTAGCKSSVVAMGDQRIAKRGNVEMKEKMEVEEEKERMEEEKSGKESKEELRMEGKIENAQQMEKEEEKEEKESKAVPLSRTSIAIPLPAILEVPATQESDRLFPR